MSNFISVKSEEEVVLSYEHFQQFVEGVRNGETENSNALGVIFTAEQVARNEDLYTIRENPVEVTLIDVANEGKYVNRVDYMKLEQDISKQEDVIAIVRGLVIAEFTAEVLTPMTTRNEELTKDIRKLNRTVDNIGKEYSELDEEISAQNDEISALNDKISAQTEEISGQKEEISGMKQKFSNFKEAMINSLKAQLETYQMLGL